MAVSMYTYTEVLNMFHFLERGIQPNDKLNVDVRIMRRLLSVGWVFSVHSYYNWTNFDEQEIVIFMIELFYNTKWSER